VPSWEHYGATFNFIPERHNTQHHRQTDRQTDRRSVMSIADHTA